MSQVQRYAREYRSRYDENRWIVQTVDSFQAVKKAILGENPDVQLAEEINENDAAYYDWEVRKCS